MCVVCICGFEVTVDSQMSKVMLCYVFIFKALGTAFSLEDPANDLPPNLDGPRMLDKKTKEAVPRMGTPDQTNLSETVNPPGSH